MTGVASQAFLSALLAGTVTAALPLLLAGLGEQMSERAGVLNIGLEGMLLLGAYAGFLVAYDTGSIWAGFAAGALAGGLAAVVVMGGLCVWLGLNQVVVGLALTATVQGLTALLHFFQLSHSYPRLPAVARLAIPGLARIPVLGPGLFDHQPLVYLGGLACLGLSALYRGTYFGLNLTAAGSRPAALDAAGVDVAATRGVAVGFAGAMAGLGGAYLSEVGAGLFVPLMSNGAGYIAIVLAMLARGRPGRVLAGALLFGACLSATTALEVAGINVPIDIIQMLPFVAVMVILVIVGRGARLPAALGLPYHRGQR